MMITDLGNNAGVEGVATENFGVATQAFDTFLNAGPTRIQQANDGRAVAYGQVEDPADFVAVHFAQCATINGEVLGVNVDGTAVYQPIPRDNPVTRILGRGEAHLITLVDDVGF